MEFEAPDWKALHSSLARRRRFAFCPVGYYLYHVAGRDGYAEHPDDWHYMVYCAKHCVTASGWIKGVFRKYVSSYFLQGSDYRKKNLQLFLSRNFERDFTLLMRCEFLSDPKIVSNVVELELKKLSINEFYDRAQLELNDLYNSFIRQDFAASLERVPLVDIVCGNDICWQLGGVNFSSMPEVIWHGGNQLNILDMNSYAYEQERERSGELFRAYCWRFRHIPPEKVRVINFDLFRRETYYVESSGEDFTAIFRALAAEAAMWRDYLVKQNAAAVDGAWHYAQLDKCQHCRFCRVCPACHGTAVD